MSKFLCVLLSISVCCFLQNVTTEYMDVPHIACPQYFEYLCYGNICIGKITLQNVQLGTTNINLEFSQRNTLQQNQHGSLSLFEDKNTTIEKIKKGEAISYRVDFPLSNVLPKLTELTVNGVVLCQASRYPPPRTTITLYHTLTASVYTTYTSIPSTVYKEPIKPKQPEYGFEAQRPHYRTNIRPNQRAQSTHFNSRPREETLDTRWEPNVVQQIQPRYDKPRDFYEQTAVKQIPLPGSFQPREPDTQTTAQKIPQLNFIQPREPVSKTNSQAECGREGETPALVPLISGGTTLRPGQFPWLTAIYHKSVTGISFICGGSLISAQTIISAAHCFQLTELTADKIMAALGRYNLTNSMESSAVTRDIKTLLINPEYKPKMFPDADVALLLMSAPVSFTDFIGPICIWGGSEGDLLINDTGYVAGWGGDEQGNAISAVPKMAPANIVSETVCRQSSDLFKILTTSRTFCAGQQDGVGPCMGDSGGGLMIKRNGVWQLRGIVSAGQTQKQHCNLRHYVVYCDVTKFSSWVYSYML